MNVQLQGVNVYGGNPHQHSVFRGQELRERRRRILKAAVAAFLVAVFAWALYSAITSIAKPPQARADVDATAVAATEEQTQSAGTVVSPE